jgi:hypothetical protein
MNAAASPVVERVAQIAGATCLCRTMHPRAGSCCNGCRASEVGRNCWETTVSPCCQLSRDSCDTCPVFAAGMRAGCRLQPVRIILSCGTTLEGSVSLPQGQRLSDALNAPERAYVPVTNVTLAPARPPEAPVTRHEVVFVSRQSVSLIHPIEAPTPDG